MKPLALVARLSPRGANDASLGEGHATFRIVLLAVVVIAILLAGCGKKPAEDLASAPDAPPLTKVRFQTDWYPQAEHGGFYQALARGFYREAGLDVEIVPGGPGPGVAPRLVSGTADLGMGQSDDVVVHVSNGLPFVIVGVHMQHDPQGILVHEESPVQSFADLDGRAVMAVPASIWIEYLKSSYGINFSIQPMNYGIAQFMTDPGFIQQCYVTNEPYYVRQNGARPRTLLIANSGYDPYRILFTTRRYAAENPAAVRAFVAASVRGWVDFMTGDPAPAKALIAQRNPDMSPAFMDYTIQALREFQILAGDAEKGEGIGHMRRARLERQVETLARLKIIPAPVPLAEYATFEFLPDDLRALADD
jgi:NitT/TauT family transport system substrate-binding protein